MILICKFERDYQEGYLALLKLLASIFEEEPQETLFYKDTFCSALFYQILDWLHGRYVSFIFLTFFSNLVALFVAKSSKRASSFAYPYKSFMAQFRWFFFAKVFLFVGKTNLRNPLELRNILAFNQILTA